MKRSSSIACLDDSIDVKLGNYKSGYEESVLVSSMMLVTIEEESRGERNQLLATNRSMSSMSATSSRSSLRGWGSSASRKSYKVDLCALAADDLEESTSNHEEATPQVRRKCCTTALELPKSNNDTTVTNHALDSWGFFLE